MQSAPPVRFPLWVLIPRDDLQAHQLLPAFSDEDTMVRYLVEQPVEYWRTVVVDHHTLVLLIGDLHQSGCTGLRVDPTPDGTDGIEVSLSELMKLT